MPILGVIASSTRQGQATDTGAMFPIASYILPGTAGSILFNSIPQTYKHLELRCTGRLSSGSQYATVRFNGNTTASNYSFHGLEGDGSTPAAYGSTSYFPPVMQVAATANFFNPSIFSILDYTSSTKNKTIRGILAQEYNGSGSITLISGAFYNTSPITSIEIIPNYSSTFASNSSFYLYGIK
jgi:hypothetical protein